VVPATIPPGASEEQILRAKRLAFVSQTLDDLNTNFKGWENAHENLVANYVADKEDAAGLPLMPLSEFRRHFSKKSLWCGPPVSPWAYYMAQLAAIAIWWLYYSLMESSTWQATLGKKALGIVVVDSNGNRLTWGRATGRHFGKIISAIPMSIGFLLAAFTLRKQALHDMMAGTFVVNTGTAEAEARGKPGAAMGWFSALGDRLDKAKLDATRGFLKRNQVRIVLAASAVFVVVLLCWLFRWDYQTRRTGDSESLVRTNRFTGRVQQYQDGEWQDSEE
jgi:hypothetical protein